MKNHKEMFESFLAGETLCSPSREYKMIDGIIYSFDTSDQADGRWVELRKPPQYESVKVKPKTININGIEVPEPVRELEERNLCYWAPNFGGPTEAKVVNFFVAPGWDCVYEIRKYLAMGFVHNTKEAALLHREALLSFTRPKP